MITLIHQLRVVRVEDDVYHVYDMKSMVGGVVRFWVPQADGTQARMFRAFGLDFKDLASAVAEFRKISQVKPYQP